MLLARLRIERRRRRTALIDTRNHSRRMFRDGYTTRLPFLARARTAVSLVAHGRKEGRKEGRRARSSFSVGSVLLRREGGEPRASLSYKVDFLPKTLAGDSAFLYERLVRQLGTNLIR